MNAQIVDKITQRIIEQLEAGVIAWDKPFVSGMPKNYVSGKDYQGINALLLGSTNFTSPYWLTYNQCKQLGGNIKSGAKAMPILYWTMLDKVGENDKGEAEIKHVPYIRYTSAFNFQQTIGLKEKAEAKTILSPIEKCEDVIANMPNKPNITDGKRPCYIPSKDTVEIMGIKSFKSSEHYYATLYHELAHSTGHSSRLNRQDENTPRFFGSEDYSKEELVAEFTSAFLCGYTGISKETERNAAAYIQSWLNALKNNRSQIITAASQAQKAYNYILGLDK